MRRIGILSRIEIAKRTYIDPQVLICEDHEADPLLRRFPLAVFDLTPKYIAGATGIFRDIVHGRFWTDTCICRRDGKPRFTTCRICGNTGRVVFS